MAIAASLLWGLTTIVIKRWLNDISPEKVLLYQLAVSGAALLAASAWQGEAWPAGWDGLALASLGFQTVVISFASYPTDSDDYRSTLADNIRASLSELLDVCDFLTIHIVCVFVSTYVANVVF